MTPSPGITALLRHARLLALEEFSGQPSTFDVLKRVSEYIYLCVLRQVGAGLWKEYGVEDLKQMTPLRVRVEYGNQLLGESPLKIEWDFSRTALRMLVVESDPSRSVQ